MPLRTEKDLNPQLQSHWQKAGAAIELRNFGYAISLLQEILKLEPEFLAGRQLLRRAAVEKQKSAKKRLFNMSTAVVSIMKAQRELKKDPKLAIEMIEKVLEEEPYNRQANLVLKEAAMAAGWPEIGVFALQTALEEKPRDTKILHELGRLHRELGQSEREVEIYNQLSEIDPTDAEALRLGKDAAARASIKTGGWMQAETYRDLIKDKDVSAALEPQSRKPHPPESLEQQIEEIYAQHQAEPQSVDLARRLGVLHAQRRDLESAIAWSRYAADLNPTDLQLRLELGERLVEAGRPREALPELQRARQNPSARLKAMNLLGCCYRELGMLDLAAKQLEEAAKEIDSMDRIKKEIVYNLGLVYEQMGEPEKSVAAMKQIYGADYGYRDVAERVERSYDRK
jgi:tetratricopeptide (TPR) repeat protein